MKKISLLKWGLLPIFIIVAVTVLGLLDSYTQTEKDRFYLTPLLEDNMGWEIYTIENGARVEFSGKDILSAEAGKTFYLSRMLTKELEDNGYTFLLLDSNRPLAVFLEDKLLYTNCSGIDMQIDRVSFPKDYTSLVDANIYGEYVRCTLPANYSGQQLTIASANTSSEYSGGSFGVMLSSGAIETETTMAVVSKQVIPAAGFAIAALLLLAIWLFAFFQGIRSRSMLLVILTVLLRTVSHLRQLSFHATAATAMDTPLALFIPVAVILLPQIYFLLQMQGRRVRVLYGWILGVSSAVELLLPTGILFGGEPLSCLFLTENYALFLGLLALVVFSVIEAKNKNTIFRLFLGGLGVIVISIAVIFAGSMLESGFYANIIYTFFSNLFGGITADFLNGCGVVLFLLSAFISIYILAQSMVQVHSDLAVQMERTNQLDNSLTVQKQFYEAKLSSENEIRSLRHDMNGHFNILSSLLENNQTKEAKQYLDGILERHHERTEKIYSNNPYINAVLSTFAVRCQENHIQLTMHIGVENHELPATELCLILNNALENAYEASLLLPEANREIKVQAAVRQNRFLVRVSNRFNSDICMENGLPITGKPGKEHGYGLFNIRSVAERKGGSMEYRIEHGYFILDVDFLLGNE